MNEFSSINLQTSSPVFAFIFELLRKNLRRGVIIGVGYDLDLWLLLSCVADSILVLESDPEWLEQCKLRYQNIIESDNSSFIAEKSALIFQEFHNQFFQSAKLQHELLNKEHIDTKFIDLSVSNSALFNSIVAHNPDWIYIDGPLGGYEYDGLFSSQKNTGRFESIFASCRALQSSSNLHQKWLIVDDSSRLIEASTVDLFPCFPKKSAIKLGRDCIAIKLVTSLQ